MTEKGSLENLNLKHDRNNGQQEVADLLRGEIAPNPLGMNGYGSTISRLAVTTGDGLLHTPEGLYKAAAHNLKHPLEMVKTVAGSAAIAATLKVALPEAGPVGKVAGTIMGVWFLADTAPTFVEAYKGGLNARTWAEMHQAGKHWGDAAGHLGVNSALGIVGFKIGSGVAGNILARQSFDNFADLKQSFWDSATDRAKGLWGMDTSIPTAVQYSLEPHYRIHGQRAMLVDSASEPPLSSIAGEPPVAVVQPTPQLVNPNATLDATVMLRSRATSLRMNRYIARMSEGQSLFLEMKIMPFSINLVPNLSLLSFK